MSSLFSLDGKLYGFLSKLAKIMWILGRTKEAEEVNRLFYTPVAHDMLHRG